MNASAYLKQVKPDLLKTANQLTVRDLDEPKKNNLVAYVDQGTESFDVQLILDNKKNIVSSSCDCGTTTNCVHQIALIAFLNKQEKNAKTIKKTAKSKLSENELLLQDIDTIALKTWVSNLIDSNKEIAFLFKNEFGLKKSTYEPLEIKQLIKNCIQSVIGKRRTIATAEVKKVVDNCSVALQPVLDIILGDTKLEQQHNSIKIIVDELLEFQMNYYITSVRISRFIENIYDLLLQSLFTIKDFEVWKKNVTFYFSLIFDTPSFTTYDFNFITKIYSFSEINALQRSFTLQIIEEKFFNLFINTDKKYRYHIDFNLFFLTVFIENALFIKYYTYFEPVRFENKFNIFLIQNLIKNNKIELAEKYCIEQINNNSNAEYDKPYVEFLIPIYNQTQEVSKKAKLLSVYSVVTYEFENYLFLEKNCEASDFKKYRQTVLTNATFSAKDGNLEAFDFYYKIIERDGELYKLIPLLAKCKNLQFVNKYKDLAFALNPLEFVILASVASQYEREEQPALTIAQFLYKNIDPKDLLYYVTNPKINSFGKTHILLKKLLLEAHKR